jgi:hypothetical protein
MIIAGIDNGSTGGIALIDRDNMTLIGQYATPTFLYMEDSAKKKTLRRVHVDELVGIVEIADRAFLERPMVMPARFMQSLAAVRAYEATLIALEKTHVPYEVLDSRKWQKELLPAGTKGPALKEAAKQFVQRNFPKFIFTSDTNYDAICIAFYGARHYYG